MTGVRVRLYAAIRDLAGTNELTVEAADIQAVKQALAAKLPHAGRQLEVCRYAMNDEFVPDSTAVEPGSVVDVIPPVSGG